MMLSRSLRDLLHYDETFNMDLLHDVEAFYVQLLHDIETFCKVPAT